MMDLLLHNLRTIGTHHCDGEVGKAAADEIECLRAELAAERERAEKAEANYRFMVERAAAQRLDGYRELGQRAADAENDRDSLRAELAALRAENERLRALLNRYRHETPLGHQPHMIAAEVDAARKGEAT